MLFKIILTLMMPTLVLAVCSSTISRTNSGANSVLTSTKYNTDLNTAYTRLNELPGDCVTDETITTTQILDGTITTDDIDNTEFGAVFDGLYDGCKVTASDTNTITVDKCRFGVNGSLVNTATSSTVTWGCMGCSSETSDTIFYVYAKTGSVGTTLNLQIVTTAPNADGYDVSGNRVLAKIRNDSSSDLETFIRQWDGQRFKSTIAYSCQVLASNATVESIELCDVWISSVTGTTTKTVNIISGVFGQAPVCVCSSSGSDTFCTFTGFPTTSAAVVKPVDSAGSAFDADFLIKCTGVAP